MVQMDSLCHTYRNKMLSIFIFLNPSALWTPNETFHFVAMIFFCFTSVCWGRRKLTELSRSHQIMWAPSQPCSAAVLSVPRRHTMALSVVGVFFCSCVPTTTQQNQLMELNSTKNAHFFHTTYTFIFLKLSGVSLSLFYSLCKYSNTRNLLELWTQTRA